MCVWRPLGGLAPIRSPYGLRVLLFHLRQRASVAVHLPMRPDLDLPQAVKSRVVGNLCLISGGGHLAGPSTNVARAAATFPRPVRRTHAFH